MADWTLVGKLSEIPRLTARVVETALGPVAVFRTDDDRVFALLDSCPHRQAPLSFGVVRDHIVVCPFHHWSIDLETGAALAPDHGSTPCFAVKIEQDQVWLQNE